MPLRTRPLRLTALRLAAAPLLLLVPLGMIKWHTDHPPVTEADENLRALLSQNKHLRLTGSGPLWRRLTGSNAYQEVGIGDPTTLQKITEVLRCEEALTVANPVSLNYLPDGCIELARTDQRSARLVFGYWRDTRGSYVMLANPHHAGCRRAVVRPHFAPQFEALIVDLVRRAKSPDPHPKAT